MKKAVRTRQELANEIAALKKKVRDLQRSEAMSKLADAGLQQEHALFLEMINTQPAGIYRIRVFPRRKWRQGAWNAPEAAPYSVELASERFCEILGITRDVFEHTPGIVEEMIYPEDRAEFVRKNVEANTLLVPFQWEGRLNVGARTIWAHFESLPRPVANGDVIWTGFLHDITDRKAAEEALVRSEASLRQEQNFNHLLLNNTSALIVAMDLDGKTLMMNKALLNVLEYSKEEVRGADYLATFVPEADREMVAAVFRKIVHEGMATVNENRIVSRSGETFLVEWHGGIAKQEAGAPGFFVGVGIDISARKQAEQKLLEREEQLRQLSDNLPGGLVYQVDTGKNGIERRLSYISAGVEALHGVSVERALCDASFIYDQMDPADAKLVAEREARAIADMAPFSSEARVRLPSGETRWRLFTSAPRRQANGRLIWDGIEIDISESKKAEEEREKLREQLQHSQKLDSIGRLAGGVAHDFNNLLEVILIHADLARQCFEPTHPVQASLGAIAHAAERSAELTRQLLAFARKQTAVPKVLDLNETVRRSIDMLRRLIGEDKALAWHPGPGLGCVRIDPAQLIQVITHLCINARDAIAGIGLITIATARATLAEADCARHPGAAPGEYAQLSVADDGCGMDRSVMDRLFEPFFTTKEAGRGTGFGLATVYGIVQQNAGFISVDSAPGRGSTFEVYLPRFEADAATPEPPPGDPGSLQGHETILVVEDEPAILEIIRVILQQQGYAVLAAGGPAEAARLAGAHDGEIDLLLTDVVMPEMNGKDLALSLESRFPRLKRLFMSGHTADIIADQGVLDEGVSFIAKPFSMTDLLVKVREVLGEP